MACTKCFHAHDLLIATILHTGPKLVICYGLQQRHQNIHLHSLFWDTVFWELFFGTLLWETFSDTFCWHFMCPLSIVFDILEAPAFQKYRTQWVFLALPGCAWLFLGFKCFSKAINGTEWDGWKSLNALLLWAPLCGANNVTVSPLLEASLSGTNQNLCPERFPCCSPYEIFVVGSAQNSCSYFWPLRKNPPSAWQSWLAWQNWHGSGPRLPGRCWPRS